MLDSRIAYTKVKASVTPTPFLTFGALCVPNHEKPYFRIQITDVAFPSHIIISQSTMDRDIEAQIPPRSRSAEADPPVPSTPALIHGADSNSPEDPNATASHGFVQIDKDKTIWSLEIPNPWGKSREEGIARFDKLVADLRATLIRGSRLNTPQLIS
jgi:hypothetical protein